MKLENSNKNVRSHSWNEETLNNYKIKVLKRNESLMPRIPIMIIDKYTKDEA